MGYYRAGGPADWDLSGAQGAAAGRGLATWLYGAKWRDEGPFMPPSYVGAEEKQMGYYRAGGGVMANEPAYDPGASFRNFLSAGGSSAPTYDAVSRGGAPGSDSNPEGRRRHKTQVINLTALRRAERRIERATRVAARLFSHKKSGFHGLKLKHKRKARR